MIPRTKVNYQIKDILKAIFIHENSQDYKSHLISLLQQYLNQNNILLMPSGRAGLYYILKALTKTSVLIPSYTCKAVAEAALLANKQVIYIESEDDGFNMSISDLQNKISQESIVIVTHQFGIPCQIDKIMEICTQKKAFVIEDVAASLGSKVNGKLTGTFGDTAFYSFDSTKLINVPLKAGFIQIKDAVLFEQVKDLYNKEIKPMPQVDKLILLAKSTILLILENPFLYRIFHTLYFYMRSKFTEDSSTINLKKTPYYCYNMANWQAYIAVTQITTIDEIIKARQKIYHQYYCALANSKMFDLPPNDYQQEWACIRFPIRIRGDKLSFYRKAAKLGVDFAFSFTYLSCPDTFTKSNLLAKSVLDLPFYFKLSNKELNHVISVLQQIDQEINNEHRHPKSDVRTT